MRFRLCAISFTAAGLIAAIGASPAVAADRKPIDVSATARGISMPDPEGAAEPDTGYAGLAETTVTVGLSTPGVPCGECVPGVPGNNIGLPWPIFAVHQGQTLTVSTWFQSTGYNGACTARFIMKQGDNVVSAGSYPFPGGCSAGYLYGVFFTVPVPETTGYTTVIGSITGGDNASGTATFLNVK